MDKILFFSVHVQFRTYMSHGLHGLYEIFVLYKMSVSCGKHVKDSMKFRLICWEIWNKRWNTVNTKTYMHHRSNVILFEFSRQFFDTYEYVTFRWQIPLVIGNHLRLYPAAGRNRLFVTSWPLSSSDTLSSRLRSQRSLIPPTEISKIY